MSDTRDRGHEIVEQRDRSRDWMENSFYAEWEQVHKSYLCERDPEPDDNGHDVNLYDAYNTRIRKKDNTNHDSVGMPDTWSIVRRLVARTTAQIPNLKFRGEDPNRADRVSRKVMRDWDKGGVQRLQKKHVAQAALFGWSVRAWYWDVNEIARRKKVDPTDPANAQAILDTYGESVIDPLTGGLNANAVAALIAQKGRGPYLPVNYTYQGYVGPKAEFLLVADCFPEPDFTSIQSSNWFIVQRKRNRKWLEDVAKAYPEELGVNIAKLLTDQPDGTKDDDKDGKNLRTRMLESIGRTVQSNANKTEQNSTPEWTIIERHTPGATPKLAYATTTGEFLGEIDYPYDLGGRIAFTESVLIDSLLSGVGDSTVRVLRGLQLLHDRQANIRTELAYNLLRPLVGTSNRQFVEEPQLLKRHSGMRLVHMPQGPGSLWVVGEQAAHASVIVGLQDESAIERQWQKGSGETNLSMGANIDPQQARTATGSRIMAYASDILAKDGIDMYTETCIKPDAEMIYWLNRSEMVDEANFDAAPYYRSYTSNQTAPKQDPIKVSPLDFQEDYEVEPEVGSTLADDDESKVQKAMTINSLFRGAPNVNQDKLRDYTLITMGEGGHLEEWAAPKQEGPMGPEPPRTNISVSVKFEMLPPEAQQVILGQISGGQANVDVAPPEAGMEQAPPPEATAMPPEAPDPGAAAGAAAEGDFSLMGGGQ